MSAYESNPYREILVDAIDMIREDHKYNAALLHSRMLRVDARQPDLKECDNCGGLFPPEAINSMDECRNCSALSHRED